jgi:MFS family permease
MGEMQELRTFEYIYIPVFLVILAVVSAIPAVSYLTYLKTGSEVMSTLVISVFGLAYTFSSAPAGIVHQYVKKEFLVISLGVLAILLSGILFFTGEPLLYVVARIIIGVAEAFVFVGFVGVIVGSFPGVGEATPILGRFFSIMSLGLVIAPALGSIFISRSLYNLLFTFFILIQIPAFILTIYPFIRRVRIKRPVDTDSISYSRLGLLSIIPILMVLSVGASDGSYQSRAVIWFTQLNLNAENAGFIITIYYISAIVSQMVLPVISKRIGMDKGFTINIGVGILGLITSLSTASFFTPLFLDTDTLVYLTAFLVGFGVGLLSPYGTEMIAKMFGKNYLVGSGFVNTIWAVGYFTVPTLFAVYSSTYTIDVSLLIALQLMNFVMAIYFVRKAVNH